MLTNIWVHNIGSCMISSYPSLHQRKSDWNRISCENFAEISISEPFRSQPGSQMADRSQAFQMSIDAASATYLVWYHLCVNLWGILGKITVGIWLVPEALRSASVRKMLFLKRTPCKWYRAHEGLKWRMGDTCSKQRYMIFKHKKFVADYLSCSIRPESDDFYLFIACFQKLNWASKWNALCVIGMPSRGLKWWMGVSVDYTIHVLQYSIHYISTCIKPFYLTLHDKGIRQYAFSMCLLR